MADTPFDEAERALWAALFADGSGLKEEGHLAYIPSLNRLAVIKDVPQTLSSGKNVNRAPNDVAEFTITQGGFLPKPTGTNSKTADAIQSYTIQILDKRATADRLNAVKWEAFKALVRATRTSPNFGLAFVRAWEINGSSEGRQTNQENRPVGNWITVFNVNFQMYWDKSTL